MRVPAFLDTDHALSHLSSYMCYFNLPFQMLEKFHKDSLLFNKFEEIGLDSQT